MNDTRFTYAVFFLFAIFIIGLVLFAVFSQVAHAQINIESKLEELLDEGLRCDIWQFRNFLYQPVEIRMDYQNTTDTIVRLAKDDSASEPEFRGDEDNFYFNSKNFTDTYTVELLLDYTNKPVFLRHVPYEIHTADGILTHEGIWSFNATQFCRVLVFTTNVEPKFPTTEEVAEKLEDKTVDILTKQNENIVDVKNAMFWVVVVAFGVAGVVIISGIIYWDSLRGVKKSVSRPMSAFGELEKKNRRTIKNNQILLEYYLSAIDEIKKIASKVDKSINDFKYHYMDLGLAEKQRQESSDIVEPIVQQQVEPSVKQPTEPKKDTGFIKKFSKIMDIVKHHNNDELPKTEKDWITVFEKQDREENEKIHDKLTEEYDTNPTNELAIQLTALRKVLFKQV